MRLQFPREVNTMKFQDFYSGHAFDAGDVLGAHVTPEGTVFRVYAPNAKKVSLV
ncbi:MAG: hypothetical protein IKU17_09965, partial [Clostridia bacterium]|nr:hypothetical protein [Clostridia bacterium]